LCLQVSHACKVQFALWWDAEPCNQVKCFLQLLMTLWPWPFTLQTKINSLNFRSSFRSQLFVVSRIRDDPQKARQYPHLSLATKCTFLIQICVVGCRQHRTLVVMFEMFRHLQTDTPQPLARSVIYDMVYSTSKRCWQTKKYDKNETASIVVESPSIKLLDYCNVILYMTVCLTTSINKLRRVHGQSDRWFASIVPSCLPINEAERIAYTQSRSWHTKSAHRKRRQHIV